MRALGFCVGVEHARYLASQFVAVGIAARGGVGGDPGNGTSRGALNALRCVVSPADRGATVSVQQLGRGLRLTKDKTVLTALDFVGHQRRVFRSDQRFRAPTGLGRRDLKRQVKHGFRSCRREARSCSTRRSPDASAITI